MYAALGVCCKRIAGRQMSLRAPGAAGAAGTAIAPAGPERIHRWTRHATAGGSPGRSLISRRIPMHYDDTVRRFNFLAGLGFGAVLGVGLAMLAATQKKVRRQRLGRVRSSIPGDLSGEVMDRLRSARKRW